MNNYCKIVILGVLLLFSCQALFADELSEISNYREYSPYFSSSGQPTENELELLSDAGFKRIVYIAFSDNKNAMASEDRVVKSLGMDYSQIPVDYDKPTMADFEDFAALLNRDKQYRTLLHCQINYRASAFSFLYRVIYAGVPVDVAKTDLDSVWQPNEIWHQLIVDVLEYHGMSEQASLFSGK